MKSMSRALVVMVLIVFGGVVLLGSFACSANHWLGESAGKDAGVRYEQGILGGKFVFSGEGGGTVADAKYEKQDGPDKKTVIQVKDASFSQSVVGVVEAQTAKIEAIGKAQEVQVQYVKALTEGIRSIVAEVVPVLKLLAMAQFADLPGGGVQCTLASGTDAAKQGITAAKLAEWVQQAAVAAEAIDRAVNPPTSQPTKSQASTTTQ